MAEADQEFIARMLVVANKSGVPAFREMAVRAALGTPPTKELGLQRNKYAPPGTTAGYAAGWNTFVDVDDYVTELRWPQSVRVFDMMRTDSQLSGLMRAMTYPIRRFKFMIDPNGANQVAVQGVADDLNLDIVGQEPTPRGRRKRRFSFPDFLFHALLGLPYGHMFFEKTGEYSNPSQGGDGLWHLRKLMPLMPRTINQINIEGDGSLISIRQNLTSWGQTGSIAGGMNGYAGPEIPITQLVVFPWEKEGAQWTGRSIFRDCYKNWLIKDRLLRVDAINHERAGGVPIAEAPPGATPAEMQRLSELAQQFKVGEESGGSVPSGTNFQLHKMGSGTDTIGSIKYHDESMARLFLHMFIQLGQTETGSRALGKAFIEYAFIAQRAVAQWFVDITNEHVIEDWVDWNIGEDEPAPLLTYVIEEEDEHLAVTELVALVGANIITPDPELEDTLRERYMLPAKKVTGQGVAAEMARREFLYLLEHAEGKGMYESPKPKLTKRVRRAAANVGTALSGVAD